MRLVWLGASLLALASCKSATETADTDTNPVPPVDTDTDPIDTDVPPVSEFRGNAWLLESLAIVDDTDTDDDGVVDNKLPDVLEAVDLLMRNEDMSTGAVNNNIANNIAQLVTVVFLDARSDGDALEIDVLTGMTSDDTSLLVDPLSYDEDGIARSRLQGAFVDPLAFETTGTVLLRVTMMPGLEPSPVQLQSVVLSGALTDSHLVVSGRMTGVIPIDAFIDDAIAPLIPEEGYEIFPGSVSTKEEVLAVIRDLAPGLADVTLPNGEEGISAAFDVVAGEWELPR